MTIQRNGTNVQTFTANQSSNVTANITVPTALSALSTDSTHRLVTDTEKTSWNSAITRLNNHRYLHVINLYYYIGDDNSTFMYVVLGHINNSNTAYTKSALPLNDTTINFFNNCIVFSSIHKTEFNNSVHEVGCIEPKSFHRYDDGCLGVDVNYDWDYRVT